MVREDNSHRLGGKSISNFNKLVIAFHELLLHIDSIIRARGATLKVGGLTSDSKWGRGVGMGG